MTCLDAEARVLELINSTLYEVVSLDDIKRASEIKITDDNMEYLRETLDEYKKYLELIESLPDKIKQGFLETLKKNEIKHNQKSEYQNMFLLELYRTLEDSNSIDLGVETLENNTILLPSNLQILHDKIMEGTEDEDNTKGYRTKNNIVVEGLKSGVRDVHFIPIKQEEIQEAMILICDFINAQATKEEDIFIKPFTVHALIALVQAFPDGNTRLARLIHQLKIWDLTRKYGISNINLPALYMSKSFFMMRGSYRENIRRIVVDKSNDAWNRWYRFSLNAVNEQINYGTENLKRIKGRF